MKLKKMLSVMFIVTAILLNVSLNALAMNTGFTTKELKTEEEKTFLSNFEMTFLTEESEKNPISCFDVNDNGLVAIGTEEFLDSTKKSVSVYDSAGNFKYGYAFDDDGSFGIEWDGNNIIIYFVRSDVAVLVDEKGSVLELQKIENTSDNNSYWNYSVFLNKRSINGVQYAMKNNMGPFNIFASYYSQIISTDAHGNTVTIYDVSSTYTTQFVTTFVAVILFVIFVVSSIVLKIKKQKKV